MTTDVTEGPSSTSNWHVWSSPVRAALQPTRAAICSSSLWVALRVSSTANGVSIGERSSGVGGVLLLRLLIDVVDTGEMNPCSSGGHRREEEISLTKDSLRGADSIFATFATTFKLLRREGNIGDIQGVPAISGVKGFFSIRDGGVLEGIRILCAGGPGSIGGGGG